MSFVQPSVICPTTFGRQSRQPLLDLDVLWSGRDYSVAGEHAAGALAAAPTRHIRRY
jgi:hypothetical protein